MPYKPTGIPKGRPKGLRGTKPLENKRVQDRIQEATGPGGVEGLRRIIKEQSEVHRKKQKVIMDRWKQRNTEGLIKPEERRANFLGPRVSVEKLPRDSKERT